MGLEFTSDARPPQQMVLLPNRFIRPSMEDIYGLDTDEDIDGITTEAGDRLTTEANDILLFEPS
jgi:hypothetical protein